jgi:hypothetical protein
MSARGRAVVTAVVVVLVVALAGAGCGAGSGQQYLTNDDAGLFLRFPDSWEKFELSGEQRPASRVPEIWSYSFDASEEPDPNSWAAAGLPDPSGFVQVTGLVTNNPRDTISLSFLRSRSLGGSADPFQLLEDGSDEIELVDYDEPVNDAGYFGVRITLNLRTDDATFETFTHLAMVDPDHDRLYELRIGCESSCFVDNSDTIGDIFDSFTIEESQ